MDGFRVRTRITRVMSTIMSANIFRKEASFGIFFPDEFDGNNASERLCRIGCPTDGGEFGSDLDGGGDNGCRCISGGSGIGVCGIRVLSRKRFYGVISIWTISI